MLCIFTLVFCLATSGCTALDSSRNTTEELQRSKASIAQLNEQIASVNKELTLLKSEVQKMKEAEAAAGETAALREKQAAVTETGKKEQVKEVDVSKREEIKKSADEKQSTEGKETSLKNLKVKVLSGNGKLPTARQMSKRLITMGYRVEDIGTATRTDYTVNTIYFAPDYKTEAQRLAAQLGGKTIAKPLTWSSVFHIIVVAVP
jgi:myosin heavy subunit